jgi:hypothetical protein
MDAGMGQADGSRGLVAQPALAGPGRPTGDAGFTTVTTALSLVASALLVALLLGTALHSGTTSSTQLSGAPGVGQADSLQAQQSLSAALTAADTSALQSGSYATLSAAALSASEPSVTFVTGPSSSATTVSVAVGSGLPGASGGGGPAGSVTLANRSSNGTCWLVWKGGRAGTWYGAQTGLSTCVAPVLTAAPSPGAASSASVGWQQGGFPSP